MGRKPKYSKEVKVQACEDYIAGNGSFYSIAKSIGCAKERVRQWYLKYEIHGPKAFDVLERNRSYSKEFKLSVIDQYLTGNYSIPDLCAKYNIGDAMVSNWINKYNNGIELNNYDPKGEVYTMKSRKTTFKERLEIAKWVIENDMSYKNAAEKYSVTYALVYKWTKSYMSEGPEALKYKKRGPKSKSEVDKSNLTEIQKLKLELEREKALRKRSEVELKILKKKRGVRETTSLSKIRQKTEYKTIDFFKDKGYTVTMLCEVLDISRSAYYKHKNRTQPEKEKQDELICSLITEYHSTFDGILGYRRMKMFINKLNHRSFSQGYIHRLMKVLGVQARIRRKKVNRKKVKPEYIKENILSRDFTAEFPNEKWLTDVTEFSIPGDNRKLYLSPIMDLYDNSIIEYELSFRNTNQLVFKMFDKATKKHPGAKPIFHSDRGFQYTGNVFKSKIEEAEMTQSMSRVGKCIDNGPMEGFFGILKSEMFYGKKFKSVEELAEKIVKYIEFYNEKRFQKKLGCMAPLEYRNHASICA